MSRNIVFEGWLTKSPPNKRIWRTKWRRRWFSLRQSGELPGQYFLDYYTDRSCRRPKGSINLDLCEQVDAGLHMERSGNGALDPKLRGSVFTIQTHTRTYHLEADCEAEMEKWVDAICSVCGLRATDNASDVLETHDNSTGIREQHDFFDNTGPYIPISECITGERAQRAFTFDPKNIVTSSRPQFGRGGDTRGHHMYTSQPQIRFNNPEFSENESNLSDDECKSLNASHSNIRDWTIAKSFTKLAVANNRNCTSEDGPPVPPRPPKTLSFNKDVYQKEAYNGPKVQEPDDNVEMVKHLCVFSEAPRRVSPPRGSSVRVLPQDDDHPSLQYCNLACGQPLPPAVDRALKPRHSTHSIGHIHKLGGLTVFQAFHQDVSKGEVLQYLDLDLQTSKPPPSKPQMIPKRNIEVSHGKSFSVADADCPYKTVDFLKTEAFNITRQDAEASRSNQH